MTQLSFSSGTLVMVMFIIPIAILCVKLNKLTIPGAVMAFFVALLVLLGAGYGGLVLLGTFFVLGVKATSHKKQLKQVSADPHPQQRTAGQVFANGGVAAMMGLLALGYPSYTYIWCLMLAASLASATADTLSSELGMVYGRNFYNILTFKKEPKGLDGVVSLEGTMLGAAGALLIAVVYGAFFGLNAAVLIVWLAGVLGNVIDSLLGATLERGRYIGNDVVNFLNTALAGVIAAGGYVMTKGVV
ncbi:MAG: DUF92 domain-containing protein [Chitinophaga sp.]|uniref:DUF92 domain-containing protein n=1 Tax=Chitinophaga sp. TaxID=1869181 RepID=UPI001B28A25E|nr:DUF92 domain-containing protein [Chitinophaga sp.]MBO9727272.1 DUF92 domain-containing protein [Chitinophaga sp.]